jgi:glutamate carboxypeptidase
MSSVDLEASLIAGIAAWAEVETPSNHPEAVDSLLTHIRADLDRLGGATEFVHPAPFCAGILLARFNPGAAGPRILLLGHVDTVHPIGTKDGPLRIRIENDRLYGPGVLDMKGGDYFAFHAVAAMVAAGDLPPSPITLMLVPDEERGSLVSRPLIEAEAARHDCVLVPEPAHRHRALRLRPLCPDHQRSPRSCGGRHRRGP